MHQKLAMLFILLFAWSCQSLAARVIGLDDPNRVPDQYIVVLKADQQQAGKHKAGKQKGSKKHSGIAEAIAIKHQARIERKFRRTLDGFVAKVPKGRLADLANDPQVEYIEADRIIQLEATQASATRGLDRIDQRDLPLDNSYTYNTTADAVNVYIIDTGIRLSHTEFAGRAQPGYTVVNDGRGTNDCNGHGTHVAGTVGGARYGVAKEVNLYAVRVLDCRGRGLLSAVIAGVDWVAENHMAPAVANVSLGGGASFSLDSAVRNAVSDGVTFVVAAGNSNANACNSSPARVDQAITVGATTVNDARASYSNWGSCVDVFAPGSSITSAWVWGDSSSRTISGTSMAAPHVAGVAALYLADHPNATPAQVFDNVVNTATEGQLSGLGSGSPNKLVYSLFIADSGGNSESAATCPAGSEVFAGTLAFSGDYEYQANGTYYFSASGTHDGRLIGAGASNFDLYLWRWNGRWWQTVASSTGSGSDETISYNGSSGYYVWRILSASGSGDYSFCLQRP